jgi:ribonuclease HI
MSKKFYVVWVGTTPGIYDTWDACKSQVDGFPGSKFKSFPSRIEAEQAFGKKPKATARPTAARGSAAAKSPKGNPKGKLNDELIANLSYDTKIYADGGCWPNPGPSGSGVAVFRNDAISELWYGKYDPAGTNNTAELLAFHYAMLMASQEVAAGRTAAIFTDSKYSIQCITQWASGWAKRGWVRGNNEPIKNLELIQASHQVYKTLDRGIAIHHVNGHVGIVGNELADRLSVMAIDQASSHWQQYEGDIDVQQILAYKRAS